MFSVPFANPREVTLIAAQWLVPDVCKLAGYIVGTQDAELVPRGGRQIAYTPVQFYDWP
jgi:hypothetical protein